MSRGRKKLKRLGCDIDGVFADFEQYFLEYFNLPTHHPTDWKDSRFSDNIGKVTVEFWKNCPVIESSKLMTYPITLYCTARNCPDDVIKDWLKKHGFPDAPVYNVGLSGVKSKILEGKCDVFVDDAYHNYLDITKSGIPCYLMTRPHNIKHDVGEMRVNTLLELQNILLSN
jgi:uncharacterized HAD superfamily protein